MKKADVKVGGEYYANVTNKKVVVRIDSTNSAGGWNATNLTTNKKVQIKTAARLQGKARATTSASAAGETRARKRVAKKTNVGDAANVAATAGDKKLSCIDAALKVLGESEETMNAQEMIAAMTDAGYWTSPGGKTPHATLYSAILRELSKGDDSRFVKVERGRFAARA
jgi:HB1, ASXL, restriction endonuclease HTH domain